jgi:2-polyprenyl-3-methyl-5-hydroxy-6-metoxy-1,4-benzoquinol methylase
MKKILFAKKKKLEYYKGILIKADLGLHEQIAKIIKSDISQGKKILDLGAGEGALSLRLKDLGYDLLSVDIDKESYKCKEIKFEQVNFDSQLEIEKFKVKYKNYFDVVIGIEVIEHIENQWEYVRLLKFLLKSGGLMIVSTPNITSWYSRIHFFFKGKFYQFDDGNLEYGHISPISKWELETILKIEGLNEIKTVEGGTLTPIYYEG